MLARALQFVRACNATHGTLVRHREQFQSWPVHLWGLHFTTRPALAITSSLPWCPEASNGRSQNLSSISLDLSGLGLAVAVVAPRMCFCDPHSRKHLLRKSSHAAARLAGISTHSATCARTLDDWCLSHELKSTLSLLGTSAARLAQQQAIGGLLLQLKSYSSHSEPSSEDWSHSILSSFFSSIAAIVPLLVLPLCFRTFDEAKGVATAPGGS